MLVVEVLEKDKEFDLKIYTFVDFFSLAENIALKGRASQSSTFCEPTGRCFNASYSVDGFREQGLYPGRGCSRTQPSSYNEWRVTWPMGHYISDLVIYNRKDCCEH